MADNAAGIDLRLNHDKLEPDFRAAEMMFKAFGAKVVGIATVAGAALVAAFSVKKLLDFKRELEQLAITEEQTIAKLGRVNQMFSERAGFTSEQLEEMADNIAEVSRFSDDAAMSSQRLMMNFQNVKGDVFQETLKLSADLAVTWGTDLPQAAGRLAGALDNPINGLQDLRQVGVTFTLQQEQMIRMMTSSGRIMDAQRIILERLREAVGGAAEDDLDTYQGAWAQITNSMKDAKEELGRALLPLLKELIPIARAGANVFRSLADAINAAFNNELVKNFFKLMKSGFDAMIQQMLKLVTLIEMLPKAFTMNTNEWAVQLGERLKEWQTWWEEITQVQNRASDNIKADPSKFGLFRHSVSSELTGNFESLQGLGRRIQSAAFKNPIQGAIEYGIKQQQAQHDELMDHLKGKAKDDKDQQKEIKDELKKSDPDKKPVSPGLARRAKAAGLSPEELMIRTRRENRGGALDFAVATAARLGIRPEDLRQRPDSRQQVAWDSAFAQHQSRRQREAEGMAPTKEEIAESNKRAAERMARDRKAKMELGKSGEQAAMEKTAEVTESKLTEVQGVLAKSNELFERQLSEDERRHREVIEQFREKLGQARYQ